MTADRKEGMSIARFGILLLALSFQAFAPSTAFKFSDFPATSFFKGTPAEVDLKSDPQARMYRTMQRTQTKEGVNFAGQYRLARSGCGTACVAFAIVDCRTGKAHFSKGLNYVTGSGWQGENFGLEYRKDSRLLIVRGAREEEEEMGTYYYLWDGKKFTVLSFTPGEK